MWQRHQLVCLAAGAWQRVRDVERDASAQACIDFWAALRLPLVVTRQHGVDALSLGLPAPLCFGRRRLVLQVAHDDVGAHAGFPPARAGIASIEANYRNGWRRLCDRLADAGCAARVYGAHGWQALTGLDHVHGGSDIDLLLPVTGPTMAATVCAVLSAADGPLPRLDGELVFDDGSGIAWREWQQWQDAGVGEVLVKRIDGARLERLPFERPVPAC